MKVVLFTREAVHHLIEPLRKEVLPLVSVAVITLSQRHTKAVTAALGSMGCETCEAL